jgi:hypothetical protein
MQQPLMLCIGASGSAQARAAIGSMLFRSESPRMPSA